MVKGVRVAFLLVTVVALSGCATPVALSLLGGGASAMVSHNLNGSVERTFTAPQATVRQAALSALENMGIAIVAGENRNDDGSLGGTAGDRAIEIAFERLGDNLTAVRATARKPGFLRDNATANEVINQTERAMAVFVDAPPAAARGSNSALPTRATPADAAAGNAALYVVSLDTIAVATGRSMKPLPARLQDHFLYTTESLRGGRRMVHVNLGYFTSEADAHAVRKLAITTYPDAAVVRLRRDPAPALDVAAESALRTAGRASGHTSGHASGRGQVVYF